MRYRKSVDPNTGMEIIVPFYNVIKTSVIELTTGANSWNPFAGTETVDNRNYSFNGNNFFVSSQGTVVGFAMQLLSPTRDGVTWTPAIAEAWDLIRYNYNYSLLGDAGAIYDQGNVLSVSPPAPASDGTTIFYQNFYGSLRSKNAERYASYFDPAIDILPNRALTFSVVGNGTGNTVPAALNTYRVLHMCLVEERPLANVQQVKN